ncbi:hypothetical protein N4P33_35315, partial [Streptomyces sp. 15-116A]|nr:hypothetical protein [Streptomyces sp. 15-116A]
MPHGTSPMADSYGSVQARGMRGILASSIGVTCAAALALPLAPPATAAAARGAPTAEAATR